MGKRAFIVTQSIKKLKAEDKEWALNPVGFKRVSDVRNKQVDRAKKMIDSGNVKKERKNPNAPARFIGKVDATKDGEVAKIHNYLDEEKIQSESLYDGLYAVSTDLLDDEVGDIFARYTSLLDGIEITCCNIVAPSLGT